jgi:hypothetical protein
VRTAHAYLHAALQTVGTDASECVHRACASGATPSSPPSPHLPYLYCPTGIDLPPHALAATLPPQAMRTAVQHTYRASAVHIYQGFPSTPHAADAGTGSSGSGAAAAGGSPLRGPPLGSSPRPGELGAAGAFGSLGRASMTARLSSSRGKTGFGFGTVPSLACLHTAGASGHSDGHQNHNNNNGSPKPQQQHASKPPRPLARVLRTVQGSGDAAFENIKDVTKGISVLPAVMALSATAFASAAVSV